MEGGEVVLSTYGEVERPWMEIWDMFCTKVTLG